MLPWHALRTLWHAFIKTLCTCLGLACPCNSMLAAVCNCIAFCAHTQQAGRLSSIKAHAVAGLLFAAAGGRLVLSCICGMPVRHQQLQSLRLTLAKLLLCTLFVQLCACNSVSVHRYVYAGVVCHYTRIMQLSCLSIVDISISGKELLRIICTSQQLPSC